MESLQLENLNLTVLNTQELSSIDGGLWYEVAYAIGAFLGACVYMGQCAQGNPHI